MPVPTAQDMQDRVTLIRMTFPGLADTADREAQRRADGLATLEGPAECVIRVAAGSRTLWNSGSGSAAEGLDGSWESYIDRAIGSHRGLKHLRGKR